MLVPKRWSAGVCPRGSKGWRGGAKGGEWEQRVPVVSSCGKGRRGRVLSGTNGDGVKMSNEGRALPLIGHLRPQAPPQAGTPALPRPHASKGFRQGAPDAAPTENQGFSPGAPALPRPQMFKN